MLKRYHPFSIHLSLSHTPPTPVCHAHSCVFSLSLSLFTIYPLSLICILFLKHMFSFSLTVLLKLSLLYSHSFTLTHICPHSCQTHPTTHTHTHLTSSLPLHLFLPFSKLSPYLPFSLLPTFSFSNHGRLSR